MNWLPAPRPLQSLSFVLLLMAAVFHLHNGGLCSADVNTDGSLGTATDLAGPDYVITQELGQTRGPNLFHSFQEFSVQANESATFTGAASIENIIGRVTGGNTSHIDGLLRSNIAGADLYLLNPYGFLFGPSAQLDISGSFHAGTADYLRLEDGALFHAAPSSDSVLSVARPEAFGFLTDHPGAIAVDSSHWNISSGETLSLIGGTIDITGTASPVSIGAPGGRVQIAGVGRAGEVHLRSPEVPDIQGSEGGRVHMANAAIASNDAPAGAVWIRGGRIEFDAVSVAVEGTGTDGVSQNAMDVAADDLVELSGGTTLLCFSKGTDKGRNFSIKTDELVIRDDSWIQVIAADQGEGGDLNIDTRVTTLDDTAYIQMSSYVNGDAGTLRIAAAEGLFLKGTGAILSWAYDTGNGGDIIIDTATLNLEGGAMIDVRSRGAGSGGSVQIQAAGTVSLKDTASIETSSAGIGAAGSVGIDAGQAVVLSGTSSIETTTQIGNDAGDVKINSRTLTITDGSMIRTSSTGSGACGSIEVSADDAVLIDQADYQGLLPPGITALTTGSSAAGSISVSTSSLVFKNGGNIASLTSGDDKAGALTISADRIEMNGGDILAHALGTSDGADIQMAADRITMAGGASMKSTAAVSAQGCGGDVNIDAGTLKINDGAYIQASSQGGGGCGSIRMIVSEGIWIDGDDLADRIEGVRTFTEGLSAAGEISITTAMLSLKNYGNIASISTGKENSGMISVTADTVVMDAGMISSDASMGQSADIFIRTDTLEVVNVSSLSAKSTASGSSGNVDIVAGSILLDGFASGIFNGTTGDGMGGDINIEAQQLTVQNGAMIETAAAQGSTGDGGSILIDIEQTMTLVDGGKITAYTDGGGDAGSIEISAPDILIVGTGTERLTGIDAVLGENATGRGGRIVLDNVDTLHMEGSASISTSSLSQTPAVDIAAAATEAGDAGSIRIHAGRMILDGGQISADTAGHGDGGNIDILAGELQMSNDAMILSQSMGTGNAGNIGLSVSSNLYAETSKIMTVADTADGGNIDITIGSLSHFNHSEVLASVGGGPQTIGGNIDLQSPQVILEDSQLAASAVEGHGGRIQITTDAYVAEATSIVDASSRLGVDGRVDIHTPFSNLKGSLKPLSNAFLNAANLLMEPCDARVEQGDYGSFVVTGRDALPIEPGSLQISPPPGI